MVPGAGAGGVGRLEGVGVGVGVGTGAGDGAGDGVGVGVEGAGVEGAGAGTVLVCGVGGVVPGELPPPQLASNTAANTPKLVPLHDVAAHLSSRRNIHKVLTLVRT